MSNSDRFLNIAAYRFVTLSDLPARRSELQQLGRRLRVKGTILLSPEGINMFLAGTEAAVREMLQEMQQDPLLRELEVKESWSDQQPFKRFLVKLKTEIIAMGIEEIQPAQYTSPRLPASQLKAWLDEGKPLVLLDVRNDYEVEVGTFAGAKPVGVDEFRDFPKAISELPDDWKSKTVVTFCTGGIRCEKAAPLMEQQGFQSVYQLEGGILKYFEEVGGEHYDGDCFVFDHRVAVGPSLEVSDKHLCFACQAVLYPADLQSPQYVPSESCPHCYVPPERARAEQLKARQDRWQQVAGGLPGSKPYDHERPLRVAARFDGLKTLDFLDAIKTHLSRDEWSEVLEQGRVTRRGEPMTADEVVRAGDILLHLQPALVEPDVAVDLEFLYEDDDWIAVNKPAPLPTHPSGRFHRHTLTWLLDQVYAPEYLRPVHRLDAATTGVVVLARTRRAARLLQERFESGSVEKIYRVRVMGHPAEDVMVCRDAVSATPIDGIRRVDPEGLPATTEFKVLERLSDGTSLLEARPLSGRTNQIRLHAWSLGFPVWQDPLYRVGGEVKPVGEPATTDQPLGLHAWRLGFDHPITGERIELTAPLPEWVAGSAAG